MSSTAKPQQLKRVRFEPHTSCKCMCTKQKENVNSTSCTKINKSVYKEKILRAPLTDIKKPESQTSTIPSLIPKISISSSKPEIPLSSSKINILSPSSFTNPLYMVKCKLFVDDKEEELLVTVIERESSDEKNVVLHEATEKSLVLYNDVLKIKEKAKPDDGFIGLARLRFSSGNGLLLQDGIPLLRKKTLKRFICNPSGFKGVVNLDPTANKVQPLLLYSTYFHDIIKILVDKEQKYVLKAQSFSLFKVNSKHRAAVVNWLLKLQQHLQSDGNAFLLSVRLFDKLLSITSIPPEIYQLVALAVYWISMKYNDIIPCPTARKLLDLCKNAYTLSELRKAEKKVLQYLNFDLATGEPMTFVRYYVYNLQLENSNDISSCANYFLDCLSLDQDCNTIPTSLQGASSVFLALHFFDFNLPKWTSLRALPGYYPLDKMKIVQDKILRMVQFVQKQEFYFREPFYKYFSEKNGTVSKKIQRCLLLKVQ